MTAALLATTGAGVVGVVGSAGASPRPQFMRLGVAPAMRGARFAGAVATDTRLDLTVVLRPRDPGELSAFANAVSNPSSPLYRHYLAPGEFAARFGAGPSEVSSTEAALRDEGLRVAGVTANHLAIAVRTTAGAAERAFATGLSRYDLPSGRTVFANASAPRLPGAIAPAVEGIVGLDSIAQLTSPLQRVSPRASRPPLASPTLRAADGSVASSCESSEQASMLSQYGATWRSNQLASYYGFDPYYAAGDDGQGVTVALAELDPDLQSDVSTYLRCVGASGPQPSVNYIAVDGGQGLGGGSNAGAGEAALDIETVAGLAPGATIDVYQGAGDSMQDGYDVLSAIVTQDKAQVISNSYGVCESEVPTSDLTAENTLFQQAASQGQTVLSSSGDSGSAGCYDPSSSSSSSDTSLAVEDPASQPYVTGVGGTSLQSTAAVTTGSPTGEGVWNDGEEGNGHDGASGGGVSKAWPMPSYQSAASSDVGVIGSESSGAPCSASSGDCRQVPDVSASADPAWGYLMYYSGQGGAAGGWQPVGGTSAASPLWAAMIALGDSSTACTSNGGSLGFLNPSLYRLAGTDYAEAFHQLSVGSSGNLAFPTDNDYSGLNGGSYPAVAGNGYSMATGLGSPIAANAAGTGLVQQLCATGRATAASKTPATTTASSLSLPMPLARVALTPAGYVLLPLACHDPRRSACKMSVVLRYTTTVRTKASAPHGAP